MKDHETIEGADPRIPGVEAETACFVRVTDLVPRSWAGWFWEGLSERSDFTWGSNNRSLVTADRLLEATEDILQSDAPNGLAAEGAELLLERLRGMGHAYVDLEN